MSNVIKPFQAPADMFKILAHPARLAILTILRDGEQCVCHMEAMLKLRQAYISQHLKILKDAGIVSDRRDGWNMYYQVARLEVFETLDAMFAMAGRPETIPHAHSKTECPCPKCHPEDGLISTGQVIFSSE